MQTSRNIFKRTLAALTLFTRLPLWRLCNIEAEHYKHVVPLWPLAGWLTGGIMSLAYFIGESAGLPIGVCVAIALISRVLLTGALHEDGFADFCDGFGGGSTRERTLEIMKDSHIGTYGVLGLVLYFLLLWNVLTCLVPISPCSAMLFLVADPVCKMISSFIIYFLPYARKESEAKIQTVYSRSSIMEIIASVLLGALPMALFYDNAFWPSLAASAIAALCLFAYMRHRIQGYTGDCCGATFIITETIFYLTLSISYYA